MRPLCVIILNYGTPALTIASAESALPEVEALGGELVIVDNASPDDSWPQINEWRKALPASAPVELILSPRNGGFAFGNNLGLKACSAEFYVLLNSDTLVRPGAFAAMLAAMRADPRLGVVGPKITDEAGAEQTSRFRAISPLGEFVEASGLGVFYKLFKRAVVPIQPSEMAVADWIGFPCVMLRSQMIDEIGGLDEGYFMYFEDCDYCRRAVKNGWRLATIADAEVAHFHGKSSSVEGNIKAKKRLPAYYYASRARYFTRWYGKGGFIAANLLWYAGRIASRVRFFALKTPHRVPEGAAGDIWAREKPKAG